MYEILRKAKECVYDFNVCTEIGTKDFDVYDWDMGVCIVIFLYD